MQMRSPAFYFEILRKFSLNHANKHGVNSNQLEIAAAKQGNIYRDM
jgi:hypothetical protein